MAKAMTKDAQIAALRETNEGLAADVVSLSDGIGALEAEIVTERATSARLVAEAQAKVRDALAMVAGDAAADLMAQIEALTAETTKLKESLRWAEGSRDEMEATMEKAVGDLRERLDAAEDHADTLMEAQKEELDKLREELEKENEEEARKASAAADEERDHLRDALDTYLGDLGYPRDPHPATISCPSLRRLVTEIN